jgi:hypothetical protein
VADSGNHRVLVWNSFPVSNAQAADLVIGQGDFISNSDNRGLSAPTAATLSSPSDVAYDGTTLAIADYGNHRVLIYDTFPTSNGASATRLLGQTSFSTNTIPTTLSDTSILRPGSVELGGGYLLVADDFFRVLGKQLNAIH